jgi:hypothetical protein
VVASVVSSVTVVVSVVSVAVLRVFDGLPVPLAKAVVDISITNAIANAVILIFIYIHSFC